MTTVTATHWVTVEEFGGNPDFAHGYYLLDGKVYQDLGNTQPLHEVVQAAVSRMIEREIDRLNMDAEVFSEVPYVMDDQTMLIPDVSVQIPPRGATKEWWRGAPEIVIEIVSPSNTKRRLIRRIQRYQANGARSVWVFDPSEHGAYTV